MDDLTGFNVKFQDRESKLSVVIDDDGRVAYAYLLKQDGSILSDVWLYNRCAAPEQPEWTSPENMPFANPVAYVKDSYDISLPSSPNQLAVNWENHEDGRYALVFLNNQLLAKLLEGVKPGWCLLAKKNGPLAKVLEVK